MEVPEGYILITKQEYERLILAEQSFEQLRKEFEELKKEILLLRNGRKSNTSSTPPSQDLGRSNKVSLRKPSTRKPGGQSGHEGTTLEMVEKPDQIQSYIPEYCQHCGEALNPSLTTLTSRKQEIIIPPIVPQCIEHQSYSCKCSRCGQETTAQLPAHLKATIQYGAEVNALVGYLSARHYLPFNRLAEIMRDVFHIHLSEGTIGNILKSLAQKAIPIYEEIKNRVERSPVVGSDETGIKINGKKGWLYTFQTNVLTFLAVSFSRGFDALESFFKNGFPISVYVTDCWAAQLKTVAKLHQICMAHLLRELTNFIQALNCEWSLKMKQLLEQAIELKRQLTENDYLYGNEKVRFIEAELDLLLQCPEQDIEHKKVKAFFRRLNKNRNAILTFLHHQKVPPDNNASERAIRTAKVKMKVSNQFKSIEGAQCFAILRSIIDTSIKNSQNVLAALFSIANLGAV